MLFDAGALLRLGEAGRLPDLDRVTSVRWSDDTRRACAGLESRALESDANDGATNLIDRVVARPRYLRPAPSTSVPCSRESSREDRPKNMRHARIVMSCLVRRR